MTQRTIRLPVPFSPADWDGPWKDAVTALLQWFMARFFKHVHADIDWKRGYVALDKELRKVAPKAATGSFRADLLFKVWLRSGEERRIMIHIEIQAQRDRMLPERVFGYNHRARDVYGFPVASFVILADDEPGWRPGPYVYNLWDCGLEFRYPTVKLLDFVGLEEELEKDANPFSVVVLAHLKSRETVGDRARRRQWKVRLLKGLYQRGWDAKDVRQLIGTIDWFLTLPQKDDQLVRQAIEADEQEKQMPYITSFERIAVKDAEARGEARGATLGEKRGEKRGEARGKKRGQLQGMKHVIAVALRVKFGKAGNRLAADLRKIDEVSTLKRVARSIESATRLDDVRRACSA